MLRASSALTHAHSDVGTVFIKAPEVEAGEDTPYNPALADVWSCGIVLVTLLKGEPPFMIADSCDPLFADWERARPRQGDRAPSQATICGEEPPARCRRRRVVDEARESRPRHRAVKTIGWSRPREARLASSGALPSDWLPMLEGWVACALNRSWKPRFIVVYRDTSAERRARCRTRDARPPPKDALRAEGVRQRHFYTPGSELHFCAKRGVGVQTAPRAARAVSRAFGVDASSGE